MNEVIEVIENWKDLAQQPVKAPFTFDPSKTTNPTLRAVFDDELAKTIWIFIKRSHLVDEHFNDQCLQAAKWLRLRKIRYVTGEQLNTHLTYLSIIGSAEEGVGQKLLKFIRSGQKYEIVLTGAEM